MAVIKPEKTIQTIQTTIQYKLQRVRISVLYCLVQMAESRRVSTASGGLCVRGSCRKTRWERNLSLKWFLPFIRAALGKVCEGPVPHGSQQRSSATTALRHPLSRAPATRSHTSLGCSRCLVKAS